MDAHITQRVHATATVAGYNHRAGGGIDPEIAAVLVEPRCVVYGHPRSSKNSFPLGGENIGFVKQGRIGHDLTRSAQLFAQSGDAGRKIHRQGSADSFVESNTQSDRTTQPRQRVCSGISIH